MNLKKTFLYAFSLTSFALAAEEPFTGWAIADMDINKNPQAREFGDNCTTLRGKDKGEWLIFKADDPVKATPDDKVEVTFTASGKGTVKIGIYGYAGGFDYRGPRTADFTASAEKVTKTVTVSIPGGSKIVRPVVLVQPGAEITFYSHSMKVVKGAAAAPKAEVKKEEPNVFTGWGYGNTDINKIPEARVVNGTAVTLKSVKNDQVLFRPANELNVTLNDKVEVKFTAAGHGMMKVGFYAYIKGWAWCGAVTKDFLAKEGKSTETYTFNVPGKAKIIRPVIMVQPNSEITFFEHSIKVLPFANPQLDAEAVLSKPDAVFQAGEKAVFTVSVKNGNTLAKEGKAVIHLRDDGFDRPLLTYDLSQANPFPVEFTSDDPGFVEVFCDLSGVPEQQDKKLLVLGGVAFSPEKIKMGAPVPADLLTYWQGEYQKLCKEVPANFKLTKVKEDNKFTDYQITADNFGGTKTYATLTIPKGEGPFPMFFNVPPAGLTVYGFYRRANTICLCTSVHDTDKYTSWPVYNEDMSKNGWYCYRNSGTRDSHYYYKSILGIMRMMDYAMNNVKEWDGKRLAAGGQSQGGGSAFLMAALNPRIQAIFADIPALCDHNAGKAGRIAGWPQMLDHKTGKKMSPEDLAYYDAAGFASFVKCPAVVSVGFEDTMCYPSSVYAAYNNLKGPKQMFHCVKYGHGWGVRSQDFDIAAKKLLQETLDKK